MLTSLVVQALSECVEAVKSAIGSGGTVSLNSNLEGADDARDALVDLASSGRVELLVLASRCGPSLQLRHSQLTRVTTAAAHRR